MKKESNLRIYRLFKLKNDDILETFREFFAAAERYDELRINEGVGYMYDYVLSGSQAERTETAFLIRKQTEGCAVSDKDIMFVWKHCYAGYPSQTRLFSALNLDIRNEQLTELNKEHCKLLAHDHTSVNSYSLNNSCKFTNSVEINNDGCHSGYTRLKFTEESKYIMNLLGKRFQQSQNAHSFDANVSLKNKELEGDIGSHVRWNATFLNSDFFHSIYGCMCTAQRNGPACQNVHGFFSDIMCSRSRDFVFAFRSNYLPSGALDFIRRKSKNKILSANVKAEIFLKGCLIVEIGHKLSQNQSLEWRFSFSESEIILCRLWNNTQRYAYGILKLLKIEYFNDLLSSYHFKTLMFWTIEKCSSSLWNKENLMGCVKTVLQNLTRCLNDKRIPHYFIVNNNLIEHFPTDKINSIISIVNDLIQNLDARFFNCLSEGMKEMLPFKSILLPDQYVTDVWKYHRWKHSFAERLVMCLDHHKWFTIVNHFETSSQVTDKEKVGFFLITASLAHSFLKSWVMTGNQTIKLQAECLFKKRIYIDEALSSIQLALFYLVCKRYEKSLKVVQHVLDNEMARCPHSRFFDLDIILYDYEVYLYRLCDYDFCKYEPFTCEKYTFARFVEIKCLIEMKRYQEARKKYQTFKTIIVEKVLRCKIDCAKYRDSVLYLCKYLKKVLEDGLTGKRAKALQTITDEYLIRNLTKTFKSLNLKDCQRVPPFILIMYKMRLATKRKEMTPSLIHA